MRTLGDGNHHMAKMGVWCLVVSLLLGVLLGGACRSDDAGRMQMYLKQNGSVVRSAPDGAFEIPSGIFDGVIDGFSVILTGEAHGMAINFRLRRAFLSYLKQAVNVKYLLLEMGPSQAGTLNRYLETGDTALLDEMYSYLKGTYTWTQESYAFWQSVYAFNSALPASERLVCVGIDIEHQAGYALAYLKTLLPSEAPPERIRPQIDSIRAFSRDDTTYFKVAAELSSGIEADEEAYERYLGEDLFEFRLVVESMLVARDAYQARQSDGGYIAFRQVRDRAMYTNFIQLHDRLPPGVYWGHFGHGHVFHKSSDSTDWLGAHLASDGSPVAGRVLSVIFAYEDCTAMTRSRSTYGTSPAGNVRPGLFDFYEGSEPILFKLIGKGSPAYSYQVIVQGEPGGSAEYFDYLLLIRGATPTQPLHVPDEQN